MIHVVKAPDHRAVRRAIADAGINVGAVIKRIEAVIKCPTCNQVNGCVTRRGLPASQSHSTLWDEAVRILEGTP